VPNSRRADADLPPPALLPTPNAAGRGFLGPAPSQGAPMELTAAAVSSAFDCFQRIFVSSARVPESERLESLDKGVQTFGEKRFDGSSS
jgi:hypothetical protein